MRVTNEGHWVGRSEIIAMMIYRLVIALRTDEDASQAANLLFYVRGEVAECDTNVLKKRTRHVYS